MKRVVITGLGALTPIGNDVDTYWKNLIEGKSGAARITHFNPEKFKTQFACELKDFKISDHLEKGDIRKTDPFTQYAYVVADQAVKDSGIDFSKMNPFDAGV